jgi:hypothetical protein
MAYQITLADMQSITDNEMVHGTMRLLPAMEDIPEDFLDRNYTNLHYARNPYTLLAEAIYYGDPMPEYVWLYDKGFPESDETDEALHRTITAHVVTFDPGLIHKIAGVGYLISQVVTLME